MEFKHHTATVNNAFIDRLAPYIKLAPGTTLAELERMLPLKTKLGYLLCVRVDFKGDILVSYRNTYGALVTKEQEITDFFIWAFENEFINAPSFYMFYQ